MIECHCHVLDEYNIIHITIMQSRATGIADHKLPLGDLFCTSQASHILNQTFQTPNQAFQALNQASPTPNEALQTLNQTSDPYAWTQVFM